MMMTYKLKDIENLRITQEEQLNNKQTHSLHGLQSILARNLC